MVGHARSMRLTVAFGVVLLIVSACTGATPPVASPPTSSLPATTQRPPAGSPAAQAPSAQPAVLRLPTLGLTSRIEPVGTDDRVLQIPEDPRVVGWWRDGARPGDKDGTIVLTAHLDSRKYGTGPFAKAKDLRVGEAMTLSDSSGDAHRFVVARIDTFEKKALPYAELFRQSGPERVVFVTCGGTYDADNGGWDSNVVVTFAKS
jgi:hypothetical protein